MRADSLRRSGMTTTNNLAPSQRRLSNLGHWIEGGLFATVAVLGLLGSVAALDGARIGAAAILVLAGLALPALLFGHDHGRSGHARELLRDPQQRQHLAMAGLLAVAGVAELVTAAGISIGLLAYVWPAALVTIGVMFMPHTQHGDHAAMAQAVRFHRALGAVIVIAGGAAAWSAATGTLAVAPIAMLVVAAMLVTYREPTGAYDQPGHAHHA